MSFYDRVAEQLAPAAPEYAPGSGAAYRAYQASKSANGSSGSAVYSPEYQAAINGQHARPQRSIYVESAYSLDQYKKPTVSKWAQRADESDDAYLARTGAIIRAIEELPDPERQLITETRTEIAERQQSATRDWDGHRALVDARATAGSGEQQTGHRVSQDLRFGHTRPDFVRQGGLAQPAPISGARTASMADVAAAVRQSDQDQQGAYRAALAASSQAVTNQGAGR